MIYKGIFILALLIATVMSCDVPGTIEIKNDLKQQASVKISYQDKFYKPYILEIQPLKKAEIRLGFGARWNEDYSNHYRNEVIDTIYLTLDKTEYYCETEECKADLFSEANRRTKKKLRIAIDTKLIDKSFTKM